MNVLDKDIRKLLEDYPIYCTYGLSNTETKPAHYVPLYMRSNGWKTVGTYPKTHSTNDFQIYKNLKEVPSEYRKMINVFRASDKVPEVIDEIIELGGCEVIWLQLGITHPEAEKKAEKAGIKVVSNRCLIIEHQKYFR